MPDLSAIQMMIDKGPAFLAEYNSKLSSLADYQSILDLGVDLTPSERVMLDDWIENANIFLQDNLEKFQKLQGLSKLTTEQLEQLKKECEECLTPLQ